MWMTSAYFFLSLSFLVCWEPACWACDCNSWAAAFFFWKLFSSSSSSFFLSSTFFFSSWWVLFRWSNFSWSCQDRDNKLEEKRRMFNSSYRKWCLKRFHQHWGSPCTDNKSLICPPSTSALVRKALQLTQAQTVRLKFLQELNKYISKPHVLLLAILYLPDSLFSCAKQENTASQGDNLFRGFLCSSLMQMCDRWCDGVTPQACDRAESTSVPWNSLWQARCFSGLMLESRCLSS